MKVALVISSLRRGGAEGVLARLANGLSSRGHAVTVATLHSAQPEYDLDPGVCWIPLDVAAPSGSLFQAVSKNLGRVRALRRFLRNLAPDATVSFMDTTNVLTLLAGARDFPVIVSERVDPARQRIGRLWEWLRNKTYPRARFVVVQTRAAGEFFPPAIRSRTRIIPNAVPTAPEPARDRTPHARPLLLGMGRLDRQKGFDLLLRAFAALAGRFPQWDLVVYGEGNERRSLETLRDDLGLAGRALFPGQVDDPLAALSAGDLFVLPSRYEGFPNALAEAMACGLPTVSFDCPSGPSEIVHHGEDGLLVPPEDISALSQALEKLMSDNELRDRLGAKARTIVRHFQEQAVLDLWEECLGAAATPTPKEA